MERFSFSGDIFSSPASVLLISFFVGSVLGTSGCDVNLTQSPQSASGVQQVAATIQTGSDGLTAEQRNITRRIQLQDVPGSIKHLYVISAFSGDCILYSTVDGKVTSSGKRLTPTSVAVVADERMSSNLRGIPVNIGGRSLSTSEVLQDDGTYGSSDPQYLYWFDVRGNYHQHYVAGGQVVHVSDVPMAWPKIILNLESR